MERIVYGGLPGQGLEVVERDGKYFVRYDAGGLQIAWREDEISHAEFQRLADGPETAYEVLLGVQNRVIARGDDPHSQNWSPPLGG